MRNVSSVPGTTTARRGSLPERGQSLATTVAGRPRAFSCTASPSAPRTVRLRSDANALQRLPGLSVTGDKYAWYPADLSSPAELAQPCPACRKPRPGPTIRCARRRPWLRGPLQNRRRRGRRRTRATRRGRSRLAAAPEGETRDPALPAVSRRPLHSLKCLAPGWPPRGQVTTSGAGPGTDFAAGTGSGWTRPVRW